MLRCVFILLAFTACASYEECIRKYGVEQRRDTFFTYTDRYIPFEIEVPVDSTEVEIDCSQIRADYEHDLREFYKKGMLETNVKQVGEKVVIKTRIVPTTLYDTLHLRDTITVYRETVTLKNEQKWKNYAIIALIGALVVAGLVAMWRVKK